MTHPGNLPYPGGIPQLKRVSSSNVFAYGYDAQEHVLYVQFRGPTVGVGPSTRGRYVGATGKRPQRASKPGMVYRYLAVPPGVWARFQKAPSKGSFVWVHLRDRYPYSRWTGSNWRSDSALALDQARRMIARQKRARLLQRIQNARR